MASITCRVIDPTFSAIQGIYASLNCKDHQGNIITRYESFSNDDGNIQYWFRLVPEDASTEPEPEIIDVLKFPAISMTFLPGIREPNFPWKSIHTELQLMTNGQHEFILILNEHSASYQLHHAISSPLEAQMEWERTIREHEMMAIDAQPDRSPSPLKLPSPIITPQASRGIKRKLTCEGDETTLDSNYIRSSKRRGVTRQNKNSGVVKRRSNAGSKRRMTPDTDDSL
ncbi:restless-like transposase [Fusarium beomiforme]|uniref:Restless-like transposase n=1 Tax=Fusarium beomiforme TaxID=44412 RepID=A0A9P5AKX5_9HYPO|nr:restless-like transposase [Fusarium beomiforme]